MSNDLRQKILLAMAFWGGLALASRFDEARDCLIAFPQQHNEEKCFALAKGFAISPDLDGRALYLWSLTYHLIPDGTASGYEHVADALARYYSQGITPQLACKPFSSLSSETLHDLLLAIDGLNLYRSMVATDDVGVNDASQILMELESRNIATFSEAQNVYEFLVRTSRWDDAASLTGRWNKLPLTPKVSGPVTLKRGELGYFRVSPDLKELSLVKAELGVGPKIVLFGFCHFAVQAIRMLAQAPDVVAAMKQYGVVLWGPDLGDLTGFDQFDSLRKQYPEFDLHPLCEMGAWFQAGFNVIQSPTFDQKEIDLSNPGSIL